MILALSAHERLDIAFVDRPLDTAHNLHVLLRYGSAQYPARRRSSRKRKLNGEKRLAVLCWLEGPAMVKKRWPPLPQEVARPLPSSPP